MSHDNGVVKTESSRLQDIVSKYVVKNVFHKNRQFDKYRYWISIPR